MRNLFDQYEQPENKLTHALVTTLDQDRQLLHPFLSWLGLQNIPTASRLRIAEQHVPGSQEVADGEENETGGLPDACVSDENGWGVFFECKIQARIQIDQIRRHHKTVAWHGFEKAELIIISVDALPKGKLPERTRGIQWQEVYCWFSGRSGKSRWAKTFVEYMRVLESKLTAEEYDIRGTITVFDGLQFDETNPYSSREGRRLIRLLGDELQAGKDLHRIGVDPKGIRRPAITGRGTDPVWDFLPFTVARRAKQFTDYPHLTIGLGPDVARAAATIPNGFRGRLKTRLRKLGVDGFRDLIRRVEMNLRPVLERSKRAKPMIYLSQRHYPHRRSFPERDGHLEADLRTLVSGGQSGVVCQPEWIDAFFGILVHKKSNQQQGIEVRFPFECPIMRSSEAVDLFAQTWIAIFPFVNFALSDEGCEV